MPDTNPEAGGKVIDAPWRDIGPFIPTRVRETMELALQLSSNERGVPQRCRKPSCQRTGCCSLTIDKEGGGHCGGGIDHATMRQAAVMLHFLLRRINPNFRGRADPATAKNSSPSNAAGRAGRAARRRRQP